MVEILPIGKTVYHQNGYRIADLDTVVFTAGTSGASQILFKFLGGATKKLASLGDVAPGANAGNFSKKLSPFLQNDAGDVAFRSGLCCDRLQEGIFISNDLHLPIPNEGF